MAKAVLDELDFRTSVKFAKGLATAGCKPELSPLLLLCGFLVASRSGALAVVYGQILQNSDAIAKVAEDSKIHLSQDAELVDDVTIATSASLQTLLSSNGDSVEELVDGLLQVVLGAPALSPDKASRLISIRGEEGFEDTLRYASSVARGNGLRYISPEAIVAGAFLAFKDGLLTSRPSISAHLSTHQAGIQALIDARQFTLEKPVPVANLLPLAPSVEDSLIAAAEPSNYLFAALKPGMLIATNILRQKRVAYHEAGHAVVSHVLRPELRITQISIVQKHDSDGFVSFDKTSNFFKLLSRETFLEEICVSLAGRVAEQKKYGHDEIDAGATSDLEAATIMAWNAITKYGLDFEFGPVSLQALTSSGASNSGWLFDMAQRRLQEVLKEGLQKTETLIAENWTRVEAVADILFRRKTLTEDDLLTFGGFTK
jgi:hypothetical protein